ncbi:MAG: methylated-DNA--[protein]-cysteine S-methyltransferase [Bacillota bacterium]
MSRVLWSRRETGLGPLTVATSPRGVCRIALPNEEPEETLGWLKSHFPSATIEEQGVGPDKVFDQIFAYIEGQLQEFHIDLDFHGTPFQILVWKQLLTIAYGTTVSYLSVAQAAGNPAAVRAVGGAVGANAVALIVPCHRVVGSNGTLTGFGGGLPLKRRLLQLEDILPRNGETVDQWLTRRNLSPAEAVIGHPGTEVFCRPLCYHVRKLLDGNKIPHVFSGAIAALQSGFQPCKVCKPGLQVAVTSIDG